MAKVAETQPLVGNPIEEKETETLNDDTYSFPVALHFGGRPWYVVAAAAILAFLIFIVQLHLMTMQVGQGVYRTVINVESSTRKLHFFFMFINWAAFQIPILVAAEALFKLGSPIGHTFATMQIVLLIPIAYLSACVIVEGVSAEDMIYRFMKLGMVMSIDNTVLTGIRAIVNYYMGKEWLATQCCWEAPVQKGSMGAKFHHVTKYFLPWFFLGITLFRAAETTGPLNFVYPLGETQVFESYFSSMQEILAFRPNMEMVNMTKRCTGAEWRLDNENDHLVPVTNDGLIAGAKRVNHGLSRAGLFCQPQYALVVEPICYPSVYNFFAWILGLEYMAPAPGDLPKEYLPNNSAYTHFGHGVSLQNCGACAANGMTCIKHGSESCEKASLSLGAKPVPHSNPEWARKQASSLVEKAKKEEREEVVQKVDQFLSPLQDLMENFDSCNGKLQGAKAIPAFFVRLHLCSL